MKDERNSIAVLQLEETTDEQTQTNVADLPKDATNKLREDGMLYRLEDEPPWALTLLMGIQHFLTMVGGPITVPFILTPLICIPNSNPVRGTFLSSIIFTSGLLTFVQTTFGARLPIVQGPSFSYLVPTIALVHASFPPCDSFDFSNMTQDEQDEVYLVRIREIQGSIIAACLFQVFIGFSGLMGVLLTWITPLTMVPIITLIGLSLFEVAAEKSSLHWGIASMTVFLMVLFSQFLKEVHIPVPSYSKSNGFHLKHFPAFKLFPVLLTMVISWVVCYILTVTGALPAGSEARTDNQLSIIYDSDWFYVPYPFQWGMPTLSIAGVFGMLSGVMVSMTESIGDYYACAKLSGAPPPPKHAINRGLGIEGLGCILCGLIGTGTAATSYSQNVGAIWITRVGSRRVTQACALIMVLIGVMGKLCGLFVTIPTPVIGGIFIVLFSLITSVGLSNLQMVDMNSSRNLFVLGLSLFLGLSIPSWMKDNSGMIQTSIPSLDQIIVVLLSTPMFVGGITGLILDNSIPGTPEERGVLKWNSQNIKDGTSEEEIARQLSVYDLPFGMNLIRRWNWCAHIPASPTFQHFISPSTKAKLFRPWKTIKESIHKLKRRSTLN